MSSSSSSCHTRIQRVFSSDFPQPNIGESESREEGWGEGKEGVVLPIFSLSDAKNELSIQLGEEKEGLWGLWG